LRLELPEFTRTEFFVARDGLADGGVAEADFDRDLGARSPSLVRTDDLLAPLVLSSGAELSGVVFFHKQSDCPQTISFNLFVGRIYSATSQSSSFAIARKRHALFGFRSLWSGRTRFARFTVAP
jgi:hypothetical protein